MWIRATHFIYSHMLKYTTGRGETHLKGKTEHQTRGEWDICGQGLTHFWILFVCLASSPPYSAGRLRVGYNK